MPKIRTDPIIGQREIIATKPEETTQFLREMRP